MLQLTVSQTQWVQSKLGHDRSRMHCWQHLIVLAVAVVCLAQVCDVTTCWHHNRLKVPTV